MRYILTALLAMAFAVHADNVRVVSDGAGGWLVRTVGGKAMTAAWTPSNIIDDVVAWYDASDTNTITESAGAVSQWDDKSTNANHLVQATGSLQPSTGSRTINDLNALDFASDCMNFNSDVNMLGKTIIAVIESDSFASVQQLFSHQSINVQFRLHTTGEIRYNALAPYWPSATSSTNTISVSTPAVVGYLGDTSICFTTDGVFENSGTGNDGSGSTTINQIGARASVTDFFNGLFGEVIVVGEIVSTETRQKVEGYLAWKWGLEDNLPTNHPHKASAPTQ